MNWLFDRPIGSAIAMLLALDIGNTNITLGVFDGERLVATWRLSTDRSKMPDEYSIMLTQLLQLRGMSSDDIDAVALCSVVPPLTPAFVELCRMFFGVEPLVVAAGTRTGIRILYDNPRDVGADRIVDAAAAMALYGGPVIVVDMGTATVFDAVTANGDYLGGAIAPGDGYRPRRLVQQHIAVAARGVDRPGYCNRQEHDSRDTVRYRSGIRRPRARHGRALRPSNWGAAPE